MNLTLRGFFGGGEWFDYDDLTVVRVEALSWPEELDVDVRWTTSTDRGLQPKTGRRNYATVFRAVSRVEKGRLSVVFDVPDLIYAKGEPVWLTLRAADAAVIGVDPAHEMDEITEANNATLTRNSL